MKSIMHEASSIAKAVEQGWEKAGNPTDFSVKILEKPQKNFFGMTTHPAKVAIYFDERPVRSESAQQRPHKVREPRETHVPQRPEPREQRQAHHEPRQQHIQRPLEQRAEHKSIEIRHEPRPTVEHAEHKKEQAPQQRFEAQWNEAMISYTREWLDTVLPQSAGKTVGFSIEPNNFYLRITFEGTVLENQEKEKRLFASLALLILEAIKRKFKVGLRKHKIILTNG